MVKRSARVVVMRKLSVRTRREWRGGMIVWFLVDYLGISKVRERFG